SIRGQFLYRRDLRSKHVQTIVLHCPPLPVSTLRVSEMRSLQSCCRRVRNIVHQVAGNYAPSDPVPPCASRRPRNLLCAPVSLSLRPPLRKSPLRVFGLKTRGFGRTTPFVRCSDWCSERVSCT